MLRVPLDHHRIVYIISLSPYSITRSVPLPVPLRYLTLAEFNNKKKIYVYYGCLATNSVNTGKRGKKLPTSLSPSVSF